MSVLHLWMDGRLAATQTVQIPFQFRHREPCYQIVVGFPTQSSQVVPLELEVVVDVLVAGLATQSVSP